MHRTTRGLLGQWFTFIAWREVLEVNPENLRTFVEAQGFRSISNEFSQFLPENNFYRLSLLSVQMQVVIFTKLKQFTGKLFHCWLISRELRWSQPDRLNAKRVMIPAFSSNDLFKICFFFFLSAFFASRLNRFSRGSKMNDEKAAAMIDATHSMTADSWAQ